MMDDFGDDVATLLLKMSDRAVDPALKETVRQWSRPPKAIQILKSLDFAVNGSLCSSFEIRAMELVLKDACAHEHTTRGDVEGLATWRRTP